MINADVPKLVQGSDLKSDGHSDLVGSSPIVGTNYMIYGPYARSDGRKHMILIDENGFRTTISYPKYLMEQYLGRKLADDETVDHKDRDFTNNDISNLQILSRGEHALLDAKRRAPEEFTCPICGTIFELTDKRLSDATQNRKKNKAGPFCSKRYVGLYGSGIQNGAPTLEAKSIIPTYYQLDK